VHATDSRGKPAPRVFIKSETGNLFLDKKGVKCGSAAAGTGGGRRLREEGGSGGSTCCDGLPRAPSSTAGDPLLHAFLSRHTSRSPPLALSLSLSRPVTLGELLRISLSRAAAALLYYFRFRQGSRRYSDRERYYNARELNVSDDNLLCE
jgi:hypothetical protein